MAINSFADKAVSFLEILDEAYVNDAKTAILDDPTLATFFVGANKIQLPKISLDGAGDYDRDAGYVQGGVSVSYEEYELRYDRGRKFRIDVIDNDEAAFDLYRQATMQYLRTKEIPEIDAIRFAAIYGAASRSGTLGTVVKKDLAASDKPLKLFDAAEQKLNENEVPEERRILFCTNEFYAMLKADEAVSRRIDAGAATGNVDRRIALLDGMTPIVRVPQSRFYSEITLYDGKSENQTAGGFVPETGVSLPLNFIYGSRAAMKGVIKRSVSKIIEPQVNQSADAYDIFYRVHHDLIVRDNDTAAIYIHAKNTAVS